MSLLCVFGYTILHCDTNQLFAGMSNFFEVKMCMLFLPVMFMGLMTFVACAELDDPDPD